MPAGLQVFDGDLNLITDITTRLGRVLGTTLVGGSPYSGDFDALGEDTGEIWYLVYDNDLGFPYSQCLVYYSAGRIYWETDPVAVGETQYRVIWGVY